MNLVSEKVQVCKICIFASGSGSNAQSLIQYFKLHKRFKVALILTNNSTAGVIQIANKFQVPCLYFSNLAFQESSEIITTLQEFHINYILLAGFLRQVPNKIIEQYSNKILNIHPALLPKYGGKGMFGHHIHTLVYNNKETETGITIHVVNEVYDKGKIIFQKSIRLEKNDTSETIELKVRKLELENYPIEVEKYILQM